MQFGARSTPRRYDAFDNDNDNDNDNDKDPQITSHRTARWKQSLANNSVHLRCSRTESRSEFMVQKFHHIPDSNGPL
jgi:hypothetical protein